MADKKTPAKKEGTSAGAIVVIILIIIWLILTIAAVIQSLVCLLSNNRTGSTAQKIGGFILAWIFGPFYWLYYGFSDYCKVGPAMN